MKAVSSWVSETLSEERAGMVVTNRGRPEVARFATLRCCRSTSAASSRPAAGIGAERPITAIPSPARSLAGDARATAFWRSDEVRRSLHPRKKMWLPVLFCSALPCQVMSITPRAERWLNMAEDARSMANRMRDDQDGKRIILEIANSYEELAAWAAKTDTADVDGLD